VRKQFYDGSVDMEMFRYAVANSRNPLCYNGDLTSLQQIETFRQEFPGIEAVMIGRGLIAAPGMLSPGTVATLEAFHNELLERYLEAFGGSRNAMFRLKENWHFLITQFEGSEKLWKQLRKTTDLGEFRAITTQIFHTLPYKNELA
jgi:tRNA-dihydrouridine synthase